jgi:hypothetical protein
MPPNPYRRQPNINDMMYPKGSKQPRQVWAAVMNVYKAPDTSPVPVSPTPTPSITPTNTQTPTPSITPTNTSSPTPSITPTQTITPTNTGTPTQTPTNTTTPTNTQTGTPTPTPSSQPPSVSYITQSISTSELSAYTFNDISIGGSGLIVFGIATTLSGTSNPQVTSVLVNGVSATKAVQALRGGTENIKRPGLYLYYLNISSGTTTNVSITFNNVVTVCNLAIWRIQNNVSNIPFRTNLDVQIATNPCTAFFNILNNDVGVNMGMGTTPLNLSWSGSSENYSQTATNFIAEGASFVKSGDGVLGQSISQSGATANDTLALLGAVWR